MSEILAFLTQTTSFFKNAFDLLKKDSKENQEKLEKAINFYLCATKAEMCISDLLLFRTRNMTTISNFLDAVKTKRKTEIKATLNELLKILPFPNFTVFPEEDIYLLSLNRYLQREREDISIINRRAQELKKDSENTKLLSEFYVRIKLFAEENLFDDYEALSRFKFQTSYTIIRKEIKKTYWHKMVNESVERLRKVNESESRFIASFEKEILKVSKMFENTN